MKKILILYILLFQILTYAQLPQHSTIVDVCGGFTLEDVPENTYFKDLNNTFDDFIGTWTYINNNEVVIFYITKVTKHYFNEEKYFEDYLVGNYSYSTDGGITYVVDTISGLFSPKPENNPMYSFCGEGSKVVFVFEDVLLDKNFCWAYFEFLPNSQTEMAVNIKNSEGPFGRLEGEPPYNFNFTLPTEMIVTKQE